MHKIDAEDHGRLFEHVAFDGEWRQYEQAVFAQWDRQRSAGARTTRIAGPAGHGFAALGIELLRRAGGRALVITPDADGRERWVEAAGRFTGLDLIAPHGGGPITVLSYRTLACSDNPARFFERIVAAERASRSDASDGPGDPGGGEGNARRRDALMNAIAHMRSQRSLPPLPLSSDTQALVTDLAGRGITTIVLDRCDRLASDWGIVVRTLCAQIAPDAELIGLCDRRPKDGVARASAVYRRFLGSTQITIPTAAIAAEGDRNTYRELVRFCDPSPAELRWLGGRDAGLRALNAAMRSDQSGDQLNFSTWIAGLGTPPTSAHAARAAWHAMREREPRLARARARFINSAPHPCVPGTPTGEGFREAPNFEDWLVLYRAYLAQCVRVNDSPAARIRERAIVNALADVGVTADERGVRPTDRTVADLLIHSGEKPRAATDVIAHEMSERTTPLRALLVCPNEFPPSVTHNPCDPTGASAAGVLRSLAADERTARTPAALLSLDGVFVAREHADALAAAFARTQGGEAHVWRVYPHAGGVLRVDTEDGAWTPRAWLRATADEFEHGTLAIVACSARLLEEEWFTPHVNCVVDLAAGDSPEHADIVRRASLARASSDDATPVNHWNVVCVASEHPSGDADYLRFATDHRRVSAPAHDGVIEAGVGHIHPALTPNTPPDGATRAAANRASDQRAHQSVSFPPLERTGSYTGRTQKTVVIHHTPMNAGADTSLTEPTRLPDGRWKAIRALARTECFPNGEPDAMRVAHAVCEALLYAGGLSLRAAGSLLFSRRGHSGIRIVLKRANAEESRLFAVTFTEVFAPERGAEWWLPCRFPAGRHALGAVARAALRRPPYEIRWLAVPRRFAVDDRASEAFVQGWSTWFSAAGIMSFLPDGPPGLPLIPLRPTERKTVATTSSIWY